MFLHQEHFFFSNSLVKLKMHVSNTSIFINVVVNSFDDGYGIGNYRLHAEFSHPTPNLEWHWPEQPRDFAVASRQ